MSVTELAQGGKEVGWRYDVPALSQNRLHENGREAVDPGVRVVDQVFEIRDRSGRTLVGPEDRAVRVRERDPDDRPPDEGGGRVKAPAAGEPHGAAVDPVVG